jgi:hypothetical protein
VHHSFKTPTCYDVAVPLIFGEENKYESLQYKLPVDKLGTSDTENYIHHIPEHCSCSDKFDK